MITVTREASHVQHDCTPISALTRARKQAEPSEVYLSRFKLMARVLTAPIKVRQRHENTQQPNLDDVMESQRYGTDAA